MTDEEIAELFVAFASEIDRKTLKKLTENGIDATLVEFPQVSYRNHLRYLQEETDEGE